MEYGEKGLIGLLGHRLPPPTIGNAPASAQHPTKAQHILPHHGREHRAGCSRASTTGAWMGGLVETPNIGEKRRIGRKARSSCDLLPSRAARPGANAFLHAMHPRPHRHDSAATPRQSLISTARARRSRVFAAATSSTTPASSQEPLVDHVAALANQRPASRSTGLPLPLDAMSGG